MKVKELIGELCKYDMEQEVYIKVNNATDEIWYVELIEYVCRDNELTIIGGYDESW